MIASIWKRYKRRSLRAAVKARSSHKRLLKGDRSQVEDTPSRRHTLCVSLSRCPLTRCSGDLCPARALRGQSVERDGRHGDQTRARRHSLACSCIARGGGGPHREDLASRSKKSRGDLHLFLSVCRKPDDIWRVSDSHDESDGVWEQRQWKNTRSRKSHDVRSPKISEYAGAGPERVRGRRCSSRRAARAATRSRPPRTPPNRTRRAAHRASFSLSLSRYLRRL